MGEKVGLLTKEASKRRRTSEGDGSADGAMVELRFTETSLGGFPEEVVAKLKEAEERMQQQDTKEIARQEAKNMLEEQLYKYRATVVAEADQLEKEQAFQQIKEYFDHGYSRPGHTEPFMEHADNNRGQRLRRPQLPEDPFNGFRRSSFFNDPLFGW